MNLATTSNPELEFSEAHDEPIPYRQRIRTYYQALGYGKPYEWAHYARVPFTRLKKPLCESRIAIVTTAAPYQLYKGDQGPGAPSNASAKFYSVYSMPSDGEPDLRISHIAYDRKYTSAEDMNGWFPLAQLKRCAAESVIGELAPRFHGLPTNRSQATTLDKDCPDLLSRLQADKVDGVVLVPNCPVCHQSVSLAARTIEQAGIASVVMGCAKDIVEYIGVSRLLFSDFPLGNAAGRPHDAESQKQTLALALKLLESATGPRTTMQSPLRWSQDADWKLDYCNIDRLSDAEIKRLRDEFDQQKALAKQQREKAGV